MKEIRLLLEKNLQNHLSLVKPTQDDFFEVLSYSLLPAGKLFRPFLCASSYADQKGLERTINELKNPKSALSLCCSAVEIHHAYTLIHDDLPSMDNDDMRRGRPSTHKKFGQWRAILAGDSLLHLSHTLLSKIQTKYLQQPLSFFNWALGAKGLILGQVYDLGGEINQNFQSLLQTHILKTARLIQTSLLLGEWAVEENLSYSQIKKNLRFGESLGLSFQLLDDLSEITEELSTHELEVNPFLNFQNEAYSRLKSDLTNIQSSVKDTNKAFTKQCLDLYFRKMNATISADLKSEESKISQTLGEQKNWHHISELLNR